MVKKTVFFIFTVALIIVSCNGNESEEDPQTGPPVTRTVDCNVQTLIDLLEDIPSNGIVINLSDCIYTFDTVNNSPNNPDGNSLGGVALPEIDGQVTINGTGNATFIRSSSNGTDPFRFLYVAPTGLLTINNIIFRNGNVNLEVAATNRKGGAILNYRGGLTVSNCTFENNQAIQGGAITNENGGLLISESYFQNNHSYLDGGAIAIYRDEFQYSEISNSDFSQNSSEANGGAIYSEGRTRIEGPSTFENNEALGAGGAIAIFNDGVVLATDLDLYQNTADMGGAVAAYNTNESIEFLQSAITENQAIATPDSRGGGIYLHDIGNAEFHACQIISNIADNGGAFYAHNSSIQIDQDSILDDNFARILGGGGFIDSDSNAELIGVVISNNIAGKYGGAIHNYGDLTLDKVNILSNEAEEFLGGGISNHGGNVYILNSSVVDNVAALGGGGLDSEGYASLFNSTLSGNQASSGSAVYFGGQLDITFCTIGTNVGNFALFSSQGSANIKNSIIAENSTNNCQTAINASGDNLDDDGSCTGFNHTGNARLESLDYNGGLTQNHAITFFSDAFNAVQDCSDLLGTNIEMDQRGVKRPQADDCDIGAFELEWTTSEPISPFPFVIFNLPSWCRLEPSSSSSALTSFQPEEIVEVIGRNINLTWYQVLPEDKDIPCWVWVGAVDFKGELDDVEIIHSKITVQDNDESTEFCPPPSGGCPIKESPLCWDNVKCMCVPCN